MSLLELDSVSVFYGQTQALHEVSLTVEPGEIVCLLGGNASGKSTTMKTILGLITPRTGEVRLAGERVTRLAPAGRIRLGLASVPEARRVFPEMSVEDNLLTGAFTRRKGVRAELASVYDTFPRLAERRRQHAGTLSGGEQQMLALGRALMSSPSLICMDEPTMGLAPIYVDRVLDLIADLNRERGLAVLMVEQNAELALSIAHRGYVLNTGHIALSGQADALLDTPAIRTAYLGA
ncbi:ABC transporter ATP-binding protein [Actinokineospora globicatena]|uniref:ABC transporter ATP-binding protein n=1 Tax=Actinokineospora globicatena TaxID=103729 RepID=A0A9W6V905_9PSEU|nr:ABC transporter ATP-binding protein [Actinokineospora globicatena]MCP2303019.1 branched-chain amino acid transport system ATP-binding protein [Actinokineospora globicatena]GLW79873.1 ABC transporter ATP-binding protein [Actinokineospora globicatena]GLW85718.1 ABC transporter ATP-binding protein [Actinokineospora globicatena]GLW90516.1 ABC transporter ATP-binding protein [Actinokineospora globicatena]